MAYKKPAITVVQEFVNTQPKLTSHSLPTCFVGPSYKIFKDIMGGKYQAGNSLSLSLNGLDVSLILDKTYFTDTKLESEQFPVSVKFIDVVLTVMQTNLNRKSSINENSMNRLVCDSQNAFSNVQPKDIIYLELNENNVIKKLKTEIKSVISDSEIELSNPCEVVSKNYTFTIERNFSDYSLIRDSDFSLLDGPKIEINSSISIDNLKVKSATVLYSYRAYRHDLSKKMYEISTPKDIEAIFGIDQIHPANPLAFAASIGLQNTTTKILLLGLDKSFIDPIKGEIYTEDIAYMNALSVVKREEVYCIIPLTSNSMILKLFENFVKEESHFEKGREKSTCAPISVSRFYDVYKGSCKKTNGTKVLGSGTNASIKKSTSIVVSSNAIQNVYPGDTLQVLSGTGLTKSNYNIKNISSDFKSFTIDKFTQLQNDADNVSFEISRNDGIVPHQDGALLSCKDAKFITGPNPVNKGFKVTFASGKLKGISTSIISAISDTEIVVQSFSGFNKQYVSDFDYTIENEYSNREMALTVSQIAKSYGNRRLNAIWPPLLTKTFANKKIIIPSFYGACAVGAMSAGLPPHQSFTNLNIGGIDGVIGSNDQFDEDDLNVIADGGVLIFCQDYPGSPVYIRHSLTTDRSSIKFQEMMFTRNVDYVTKFIRKAYSKYNTGYNVTESLLDDQKRLGQALISFLRDKTSLPKIGSVIRDGSLVSCKFGEQIDETELEFSIDFPIPLNNITIKIKA